MRLSFNKFLPAFLIASICAILYFLIIHHSTIGLTNDGINFIQLANAFKTWDFSPEVSQNLSPLYPVLLAFVSFITHLDILTSGEILQTFFVFSSVFVFIKILEEFGLQRLFSVFFTFFFIGSKPVEVFIYLLSEGLFYTVSLLSFWVFTKWIRSQQKNHFYLFCVLISFLILSRYAGLGFVLGYGFYLLFLQSKELKKRILESFILSLTVILTLGGWVVFTHFSGMNWTSRELISHPISAYHIFQFFFTLRDWFFSNPYYTIPLWIIFSVILSCILFFVFLLRKSVQYELLKSNLKTASKYFKIIFSLIIAYLVFITFSISFIDALTPLDNRIVGPIFPLILFFAALIISKLQHEKKLFIYFLCLCFLFSIKVNFNFYSMWKNQYENGSDYTSKSWKDSETVAYLKENTGKKYVTNGIELIRFYAPNNKNSNALPYSTNVITKQKNYQYKLEILELEKALSEEKIEILYFNEINWKKHILSREKILKIGKNFEIYEFNDGFIIRKSKAKK